MKRRVGPISRAAARYIGSNAITGGMPWTVTGTWMVADFPSLSTHFSVSGPGRPQLKRTERLGINGAVLAAFVLKGRLRRRYRAPETVSLIRENFVEFKLRTGCQSVPAFTGHFLHVPLRLLHCPVACSEKDIERYVVLADNGGNEPGVTACFFGVSVKEAFGFAHDFAVNGDDSGGLERNQPILAADTARGLPIFPPSGPAWAARLAG